MRAIRLCAPIFALLAATPAFAQQADLGGPSTIVPGSGPGTNVHGTTPGPLMEAANAEDAAKRQNLKPVTFLASKMIGVEVRNAAGGRVGTIEDLLVTGGTMKAVVINVTRFLGLDDKRIMGDDAAAVMVAAILQRAEHIKSPGGYLRALVERKRRGEFSLGPVLQALNRARLASLPRQVSDHGRTAS